MNELSKDELSFLETWEEVYRRGVLTFWVLFILSNKPADAQEVYTRLEELCGEKFANQHSLYRLFRRLCEAGLLDEVQDENRGKTHELSDSGARLLRAFTLRNIAPMAHTLRT